MMNRKIIALPSYAPTTSNLKDISFNPIEIRHLLFYFDEIIYPSWNMAEPSYNEDSEITLLTEQGIIERVDIDTPIQDYSLMGKGENYLLNLLNHLVFRTECGMLGNYDLYDGINELFHERLNLSSSDDIIFLSSNCLKMSKPDIGDDLGLNANLIGLLPVPSLEVNINEIIEFKDKYRKEYVRLHNSIDSAVQDVLSRNTISGMKLKIEEITDNVNELISLSRGGFFGKLRINFTLKFPIQTLKDVFDLSKSALDINEGNGMGGFLSHLLGSSIGMSIERSSIPKDLEKYMYVSHMKDYFGLLNKSK